LRNSDNLQTGAPQTRQRKDRFVRATLGYLAQIETAD
jgi:hypothetical protein